MIVLLTGASSGIARATALACAARGDAVVLAARNEADLRDTEARCTALGARTLVAPLDVTDRDAVGGLFERARDRFGRVDAVVHAAALLAYGRFDELPAEVFDRVLDTNIRGTANVARGAIATFRGQGAGHLVLLGSVLGDTPIPEMTPYVASKWALHGFARSLQIEARRTPGIDVSLVTPPGVPTPIYRLAATYTGRVGRPPPPTSSPEKLAAVIVSVIDRPRRKRRVGLVNPVAVTASRLLPGLYDAVAEPFFRLAVQTRKPVAPHPGNVFESLPHHDGAG